MHRRLVLLLLLAALGATNGRAQTPRSGGGGGEQQRFMQQYQQIAGEKAALQGQLDQMKKDLDAANAKVAALTKERDALKARSAAAVSPAVIQQLTASKESAERNVEQAKQRMTEIVQRFREMATNLKEIEAERTQLKNDLGTREAAYDRCAVNNQKLYDLNGEILEHFSHIGAFTRASADEPFTRITRNRLDNLIVETHERAEVLREREKEVKGQAPSSTSRPP